MAERKRPTDAKILRDFEKFETGFNTAMALLDTAPELVYPGNMQAVGSARDIFWRAHREYRWIANAALERKEAKSADR